ncbi:MAG TPA: hypothetical protein DD400_01845 [Rhodospirillaceae bacterium]|nr:hypothetical protein [Rhodospirillaceae bacterium]
MWLGRKRHKKTCPVLVKKSRGNQRKAPLLPLAFITLGRIFECFSPPKEAFQGKAPKKVAL